MASSNKFQNPRDQEIHELHVRYIAAMGDRLPSISEQTKGHYLSVLKSLTQKLEVPGKPLSEIISEVMADAAPLLFQVMQR